MAKKGKSLEQGAESLEQGAESLEQGAESGKAKLPIWKTAKHWNGGAR